MIIRKGYLMGKRFNSDEMQKVFEIMMCMDREFTREQAVFQIQM